MPAPRHFPRSLHRFLLIGLVVGVSACTGEPEPTLQSMHFDVDARRLGEEVVVADLGIRFRPPAGWDALAEGEVDSVRQALARTNAAIAIEPRYVFAQPSGGMLSVSTIPLPDSLTFTQHVDRYETLLVDQFSAEAVRTAQFLKDDIHMAQFLVQPPGLVTFKLLFASPLSELVQIDYIVPQAHYAEAIKAIESSIGSIHYTP